jgi:RNA polymerase sigma-70 factor (ECF subfamily)
MALSDEDLLRQVAAGGKEAYVALYDRYAPRVFGLLLKLLPTRTEAEDVLQEVMWELWRKADRYDPAIAPAQTWILLTARSRAIDAGRRLRRAADLALAAAELARSMQDGVPPAPDRLDAGRLDDALALLPVEQSTAIRLAYVHGLTRHEIAEATGVPIGTVKTRIGLGIRKLADAAGRSTTGVAR